MKILYEDKHIMNTCFLNYGDRVRAIIRVYDLPGTDDPGIIHAEPGDEGVVVHTQEGLWPTVTFDKTGTSTCVTTEEVEKICST